MSIVGISTFENEEPRKYFTLQNEQYLRRFSFGSDWTTLSIGILFSIDATASIAAPLGCGLWVGLGSYVDNGWSGWKNKASVVRMTGGGFGRIGQADYGNAGPLTFATNATGSYVSFNLQLSGKIVNGAFTVMNGVGAAYYFMTTPTGSQNGRKCLLTQQHSQTSTFISSRTNPLTTFAGSPAVERYSHTDGTMFSAITEQGISYPDVNGVDQNQGTSNNNLPQDYTRPLDTLNIFWTGSVPIRIYQIAIARTS